MLGLRSKLSIFEIFEKLINGMGDSIVKINRHFKICFQSFTKDLEVAVIVFFSVFAPSVELIHVIFLDLDHALWRQNKANYNELTFSTDS